MLNKFPFHRILVLSTLLGVNLVACNTTPALTSTVAPKQTPISTQTSEVLKTLEISPMPTKDPLASEPEGTKGTDENGPYIEVNTKKLRPITLKDEIAPVWAFSATEGEKMIALYDWDENSNKLGWSDQIRFQFFIDPTVLGADTFPAMSYVQEVWRTIEGKPTFIGVFLPMLIRSRAINAPSLKRLENVVYHFTTSAGSFDWAISYENESDATTIIRNEADLPLVEGKGVWKVRDPFNGDNYFVAKVYAVDGKLVTEIASKMPLDKLNDKERAFMAMFGPLSVILNEDLENDVDLSRINELARIAIDGGYPYIIFDSKK